MHPFEEGRCIGLREQQAAKHGRMQLLLERMVEQDDQPAHVVGDVWEAAELPGAARAVPSQRLDQIVEGPEAAGGNDAPGPGPSADGALGPLESDAERRMERGEQEPRNALRFICINNLQDIHIGRRGSRANTSCPATSPVDAAIAAGTPCTWR